MSRSRILMDIKIIFESLKHLTKLRRVELNLNFSTKIFCSEYKLHMKFIQILILGLNYSPSPESIFKSISFDQLSTIQVDFSFSQSQETLNRSLVEFTQFIKDHSRLKQIKCSVRNSPKPSLHIIIQSFNALIDKGILESLELSGFSYESLMEYSSELIKISPKCHLSFLNSPSIIREFSKLIIGGEIIQLALGINLSVLISIMDTNQEIILEIQLKASVFDKENQPISTEYVCQALKEYKKLIRITMIFDQKLETSQSERLGFFTLLRELPLIRKINFLIKSSSQSFSFEQVDIIIQMIKSKKLVEYFNFNRTLTDLEVNTMYFQGFLNKFSYQKNLKQFHISF